MVEDRAARVEEQVSEEAQVAVSLIKPNQCQGD